MRKADTPVKFITVRGQKIPLRLNKHPISPRTQPRTALPTVTHANTGLKWTLAQIPPSGLVPGARPREFLLEVAGQYAIQHKSSRGGPQAWPQADLLHEGKLEFQTPDKRWELEIHGLSHELARAAQRGAAKQPEQVQRYWTKGAGKSPVQFITVNGKKIPKYGTPRWPTAAERKEENRRWKNTVRYLTRDVAIAEQGHGNEKTLAVLRDNLARAKQGFPPREPGFFGRG